MKNRKNICTQIGDLLYFKSEKYFLLSWTHSAILKSVSSASSCVSQAIKDVLSQYEDERAAKYADLPGVKQPGEFFDDEKVETRPQRERREKEPWTIENQYTFLQLPRIILMNQDFRGD